MKLFELRPKKNLPKDNDPWKHIWDCSDGFVIRAETEAEARNYADCTGGRENGLYNQKHPWLDEKYTNCTELITDGKPGIIMEDFHAG